MGTEQDRELPFTVAVTPFEKENSSIRGLARIYLDDCFAVSNVSLIMGKKGMFVSMPSYKTNQIDENNREVYHDICYPVTSEFRGKVNNLLMDAYNKAVMEVQENVMAQAEQVKQVCEYVGMLEQQLSFMTEEIKNVRQELVSMKEDTISNHVKQSLQKTADVLQKQCNSLKQQIKKVKGNICGRAGKIVDAAKRKGQRALYKITKVTGMRKKLAAVKDKANYFSMSLKAQAGNSPL